MEFVLQHGNIGQYSESQVESYHHTYNRLLSHHINCGKNMTKQHHRALADTCIQAVTQQYAHVIKPRICPRCKLPIKKQDFIEYCHCNK